MVLEYKNIKLGNRNIKVRNWKVKDRDEFKKLIKNGVTQEDVDDARYKTLLFNVLENESTLLVPCRLEKIGNNIFAIAPGTNNIITFH